MSVIHSDNKPFYDEHNLACPNTLLLSLPWPTMLTGGQYFYHLCQLGLIIEHSDLVLHMTQEHHLSHLFLDFKLHTLLMSFHTIWIIHYANYSHRRLTWQFSHVIVGLMCNMIDWMLELIQSDIEIVKRIRPFTLHKIALFLSL